MDTWTESLHLLNRVLEALPLLPFVAGWIRWSNVPHRFNLVLYYVEVESILYIIATISRSVFRNDIYVFHISTVLAVILLAQTYSRLLVSMRIKKFIVISVWVFLVVAFLDATLLNGLFTDVNSYSQALGSVILITLSLLHIMQVSRSSLNLEEQPEFFLSIAVLIYFSYTIITYVATNVIYNSGYDVPTTIRLDDIISGPDALLFAIHMGLLAWMFHFFPLSVDPRRALPRWLHYSRWYPRPYKLLGQSAVVFRRPTPAAS